MFSLPACGSVVALLIVLFAGEFTCNPVIQGPMDQSVIEGETVVLTCQVRNKGNFKVFWYFDPGARYLSADAVFFEDARDPRLSIVGDPARGFFNLRISPVRRTDAGIYRCGFVPVGSTQLRDVRAQLTVLIPPLDGFPRCEVNPPVGVLAFRQRGTLTCTSEGGIPPASLTWLQNGLAITPAVMRRNVIERLFDEALNGAEFICQARSRAFQGVRTCSIVPLRIDPMARIEPPQRVATPGKDVTFTCIVEWVSQIVEYTWVFGNIMVSSIEDGDRFELTMNHRILTIRNVQLGDDMTSVKCTVFTQNGLSATAGALLRVVLAENTPTVPTTLPEITTIIPTTLTVDPNQTLPLPTPDYGGGLGGGTIIGIIIGAIAAAQIVIACVVFTAHKISSKCERRREMAMVPSLAGWTGQQTRYPPYQGLAQTGRSSATLRYLSLHPLRAPPSRYSSTDVGVYEAAVDSNTNTMVYESGYVPNNNTTTPQQANRDSLNELNNVYQFAPTTPSLQMDTAFYEKPNESAAVDQSSREVKYYEPPVEETPTKQGTTESQQALYYEPPPDETNEHTLSDEETDNYELPPVVNDQQQTDEETDNYELPPVVNDQQQTDETEAEYYEPPTELTTTVTESLTGEHDYDVTPDDDNEYEIPANTDMYVEQG